LGGSSGQYNSGFGFPQLFGGHFSGKNFQHPFAFFASALLRECIPQIGAHVVRRTALALVEVLAHQELSLGQIPIGRHLQELEAQLLILRDFGALKIIPREFPVSLGIACVRPVPQLSDLAVTAFVDAEPDSGMNVYFDGHITLAGWLVLPGAYGGDGALVEFVVQPAHDFNAAKQPIRAHSQR
jgi:hypothetical protein